MPQANPPRSASPPAADLEVDSPWLWPLLHTSCNELQAARYSSIYLRVECECLLDARCPAALPDIPVPPSRAADKIKAPLEASAPISPKVSTPHLLPHPILTPALIQPHLSLLCCPPRAQYLIAGKADATVNRLLPLFQLSTDTYVNRIWHLGCTCPSQGPLRRPQSPSHDFLRLQHK